MKYRPVKGFAAAATLTLLSFLSACTSKPTLKQVDSGGAEQPINTPEIAKELKQKHQK